MSHIDRGHTKPALQRSNLSSGLNTELRIQVRQGLVHEEYLGLSHNGATHGNPLALTTGQSLGLTVQVGLEVQKLGGFEDARCSLILVDAGNLESESHVFRHRHVGVEGVVLEDHGDVPVLRRNIGDITVTDQDSSIVDFFQAREHAKRGGLPAARRAHENEELAIIDGEIQSIHSRNSSSRVNATCFIKRHRRHCFLLHRQVRAGRSVVNGNNSCPPLDRNLLTSMAVIQPVREGGASSTRECSGHRASMGRWI